MRPSHVARQALATLPSPLCWRARNAVALAQWLAARVAGSRHAPACAADFWALHESGDWDGFARLVRRFSASQPGHGGTLHMHERPPAYWQARFAACGLAVSASDAELRAATAALDLPPWYAANIHRFARPA